MSLKSYEVGVFGSHEGLPSWARHAVIAHNSRFAAKTQLVDHWGASEVFVTSKTGGVQGFKLDAEGKLVEIDDAEAVMESRKLLCAMTYLRKRTLPPTDVVLADTAKWLELTESEWAPGAVFKVSYQIDGDEVVREYRWRSRAVTRYHAAARRAEKLGGWVTLEMLWTDEDGVSRCGVVTDGGQPMKTSVRSAA
jgi:hypothetical protein